MGMMIIRHKVRDYGQWRPIFDGHAEKGVKTPVAVTVFPGEQYGRDVVEDLASAMGVTVRKPWRFWPRTVLRSRSCRSR